MVERVICFRYTAGQHPVHEPDPSAPSVIEVVEAMRQTQLDLETHRDDDERPELSAAYHRLDDLIARLEGE